jgi:fluoroacetyl-CoA thioesterase
MCDVTTCCESRITQMSSACRDAASTPAGGTAYARHMELTVGLTARVELTVGETDTAQALGSGDVPVLATPRLVALAEAATVAATARHLDAGRTTVGTRVELDHQAATGIGRHVTVLAILAKIEGRRLTFDIVAREGTEQIAEGRVERVIVDRQRFLEKTTQ